MVEFLSYKFAADFTKNCPTNTSSEEKLSWGTLENSMYRVWNKHIQTFLYLMATTIFTGARMLCKSKVIFKRVYPPFQPNKPSLSNEPNKSPGVSPLWRVEGTHFYY